jgi:hypothetical protein
MSLSQVVSATEVGAGAADGEPDGGDARAAGLAHPGVKDPFAFGVGAPAFPGPENLVIRGCWSR